MNVTSKNSPERSPGADLLHREQSVPSELTATAVLLMLPKHARTPVAVIIDRDEVPSSVKLDVYDGHECFVRLRRGANAHGLTESYRQVSRDEFPPEFTPVETVRFDRYVQARFPHSASLFGAPDAVAFVPRDARGRAYQRVHLPIPSLDNRSWHDFTLASQSRTECTYRIADGASARDDSNVLRSR
jgi:hypothetical protein